MSRRLKLYPERQRCLKCRKFFGPLVVQGLYDSYQCAGKPLPVLGTDGLLPRTCRNSKGKPKRVFLSQQEADNYVNAWNTIHPRKAMVAYGCDNCHNWHMATVRTEVQDDPGKRAESGSS